MPDAGPCARVLDQPRARTRRAACHGGAGYRAWAGEIAEEGEAFGLGDQGIRVGTLTGGEFYVAENVKLDLAHLASGHILSSIGKPRLRGDPMLPSARTHHRVWLGSRQRQGSGLNQ